MVFVGEAQNGDDFVLLFVVVGCFLPGDEKVEKHGVGCFFPRVFFGGDFFCCCYF